jgi:predicted nucleotidyltransferase
MNIRETVRSYFAQQENILCAYLFGSFAARKENKFSDIDIAVLFDELMPRKEYSRLILSMMDSLSLILDRNVDIVVLNNADSFLKFQVIKKGERIYERPDRRKRDFEAMAVIEYFDFLPVRERLEAAVISGIKGA